MWLGMCALLAGCDPASRQESAPGPEDGVSLPAVAAAGPTVIFLGDSVTAGLGLSPEEAFPHILQRRLGEEGFPFRLVNGGMSGDTTSGGVTRLDWLLEQEPAILVVELGANDGLRGAPVETIEANLRRIVVGARAAGARVLLLGMRLPPSYGAEYAEALDAMYPRLARSLEVAFVPFFMRGVAGVPERNQADGIHPDARGHEILADAVLPELRALLEANRAQRADG
jgi:acyl-CoA thioesterase-1